jgi:predicted  nucleic acid-binding Zn ribbon protein
LAIGALIVGAMAATVAAMPRAVEANRRACMAAHANDLYADLAAFGQDPSWQAQYVEALAACSP